MRKINKIQAEDNLNEVYAADEIGVGGANHRYLIQPIKTTSEFQLGFMKYIDFQKGARFDPMATHGVLDEDLLEIIRDRLSHFQQGEFSCEENAQALYHITEALKCLNERKQDRKSRGVIGKYVK